MLLLRHLYFAVRVGLFHNNIIQVSFWCWYKYQTFHTSRISTMDTGTAERKNFETSATLLCRVLEEETREKDTLLQWSTERSSVDDSIFLKHPPVYSYCNNVLDCSDGGTGDYVMNESLIEDPDVEHETPKENRLEWMFSIVYSETWNVPVLYFNVFKQLDRIPCQREEVLAVLKEHVEDSWEFLSYDEHPATGVPSLFLHPCQTKERIARLNNGDRNVTAEEKLWSWMSLILPVVGFSIPSKIFLRVQQRLKATNENSMTNAYSV